MSGQVFLAHKKKLTKKEIVTLYCLDIDAQLFWMKQNSNWVVHVIIHAGQI